MLTSFHQSPAADRAGAAPGRRRPDHRRLGRLPRQPARRPPAPRRRRCPTTSPSRSAARRRRGRRLRAAAAATTALAVRARRPPRAAASADGPYVVVHPGAPLRRRRWPARHAARARRSRPRRPPGGRDRRRPTSGALTARVAGRGRHRPRRAHRPRRSWRPCWPRAGGRGRQHRPRPPGRRGGTPVVSLFAPVVPAERWAPTACRRAARRPGRAVPRHAAPAPAPCRVTRASRSVTPDDGRAPPSRHLAGAAARRCRVNVLLWHVHGSWTTAFVQGGTRVPRCRCCPTAAPDGRRAAAAPGTGRHGARGAARASCATSRRRRGRAPAARGARAGRRLARPAPRRDLPAVYVEHNAPKAATCRRRATRSPTATTCCSSTSPTSTPCCWDTGRDPHRASIEHGIVDPGRRYTGELPRAAVVINEPVRRGRVTGTDLLAGFAEAAPLDVFGIGVDRLAERLRATASATATTCRSTACTPSWPAGGSTCTPCAGRRSACR